MRFHGFCHFSTHRIRYTYRIWRCNGRGIVRFKNRSGNRMAQTIRNVTGKWLHVHICTQCPSGYWPRRQSRIEADEIFVFCAGCPRQHSGSNHNGQAHSAIINSIFVKPASPHSWWPSHSITFHRVSIAPLHLKYFAAAVAAEKQWFILQMRL